jgi:tRNA splicing ligase
MPKCPTWRLNISSASVIIFIVSSQARGKKEKTMLRPNQKILVTVIAAFALNSCCIGNLEKCPKCLGAGKCLTCGGIGHPVSEVHLQWGETFKKFGNQDTTERNIDTTRECIDCNGTGECSKCSGYGEECDGLFLGF